ncbi:MAG: helix-turn-helix transcriptional regulator, partial [Spirochaetes bacterium]|nr:helix-turn-helix transcriptional regulator [Spirochaetota bacterium]
MPHLIIFYNIIVLFILLVSFNIPVIIFFKTKDKFLLHYILFFLSFILHTISIMSLTYLFVNTNILNYSIFYSIFIFSEITFIFMMVSVAFFIYYLYCLPNAKVMNKVFLIIAMIEIIIIPFYTKIIIMDEKILIENSIISRIPTIIFIIVIIYALIIGIFNYKKIKNKEIRNIAKANIIISGIFFPGHMYDFYQKMGNVNQPLIIDRREAVFLVHPIFYCILSVVCTYFIIRYYFNLYKVIIKEVSLDSFVKEHNISLREKDIITLIIKGQSNKEIADNLFISVNTVKTHIRNIYEKIGIKSRYE